MLANPSLSALDLQRVLDHWYLGPIRKFKMVDGYHKVYTTHGIYLVFARRIYVGAKKHCPIENRQQFDLYLQGVLDNLRAAMQPTKQLLKKNYRGELDPSTSAVHQGEYHYLVFELI